MNLLGLTGKKKAGKDTTYASLLKHLKPKTVIRMAFADDLKKEVALACGVTVQFIEKNKDVFRPILQWWGTDFRRKLCGENYWVDKMLAKLVAIDDTVVDLVVITDVRFQNEAELVQKVGGKMWRIVRTFGSASDTHPSEVEQDSIKVDYTIYNEHSFTELAHDVELAYQQTLL